MVNAENKIIGRWVHTCFFFGRDGGVWPFKMSNVACGHFSISNSGQSSSMVITSSSFLFVPVMTSDAFFGAYTSSFIIEKRLLTQQKARFGREQQNHLLYLAEKQ